MKYTKCSQGYIIRLEKGEQIIQAIKDFCKTYTITSAYFNGIGAVQNAELGYYRLDQKEYSWKKFDTAMEVVSLTGNVSQVDGEPFLHIHTVLAYENFQTAGGHLKEAVVGATLEIFMQTVDTKLTRFMDDEIGLKLLTF